MKSVIEKYGIDGIWHFTDQSNIESIIKQGGLLSLDECEKRGVTIPAPGGNQWSHDADRLKGLHKYIHLSFVDEHPMLYAARQQGRISNPVWLKIETSVLDADDIRFSADVSNKADIAVLNAEEAKEQIDFDVLLTYMDWKDPEIQSRRRAAVKSEILIPNFISIDKILSCKNG